MELRFRTVKTRLGYAGLLTSRRGLRRLYLPVRNAASLKSAIAEDAPDAIEDPRLVPALAQTLRRYFAGEPVEFPVRIDWTGWTPFEVDVWRACRRIGYGRTRTYKHLAKQVGRPGAARAVGTAMRRNPCPLVVPCHRVIKSDGSMGGFSAPGGVALKRRLLQMEAASSAV